MTKIEIPGLPDTDRVFLLDSGDYVRSRFRVKRLGASCKECACTFPDIDEPHVVVRVSVALCDAEGEILYREDGEPECHAKYSMSAPLNGMQDKPRSEFFECVKARVLGLFAGELNVRREFSEPPPELDHDLV